MNQATGVMAGEQQFGKNPRSSDGSHGGLVVSSAVMVEQTYHDEAMENTTKLFVGEATATRRIDEARLTMVCWSQQVYIMSSSGPTRASPRSVMARGGAQDDHTGGWIYYGLVSTRLP